MGKESEREDGIPPAGEEQTPDLVAREGAEWEKLWGVQPPLEIVTERERIMRLAKMSPGLLNLDQIRWLNDSFDSDNLF